MNERFKQMAEEAFFDESTNGPGQKMYMFGELKMQKFAELIVKECADKAHELIKSDGNEFPAKSVSYRLKQHFGVGE